MNAEKLLLHLSRLVSRKFLTALGAEGAAISVLLAPSTGDTWADVVLRLGALAAMALTAWGYSSAQAKVDAAGTAEAPEIRQ